LNALLAYRSAYEIAASARARQSAARRCTGDQIGIERGKRRRDLARADHLPGQIIFQRPKTPRLQ
jgi:hypothetical protein